MEFKTYVRMMYEQAVLYERFARKYDLHRNSLQILLWILNYPKDTGRYIMQQQLGEKTCSSKQVIHSTIKKWQQRGWVELLESPEDRRCKRVKLTELGLRVAEEIDQQLHTMEKNALESLTTEEQEALLQLTAKYNDLLKKEMEE